MRNTLKKQKELIKEGNQDGVQSWTITNIDEYIPETHP